MEARQPGQTPAPLGEMAETRPDESSAAKFIVGFQQLTERQASNLIANVLRPAYERKKMEPDEPFVFLFGLWQRRRAFEEGEHLTSAHLSVLRAPDAFFTSEPGLDRGHEKARLMKLLLDKVYGVPVADFAAPQPDRMGRWQHLIQAGADSDNTLNKEAQIIDLYCEQLASFQLPLLEYNNLFSPAPDNPESTAPAQAESRAKGSIFRDCFDLVCELVYQGNLEERKLYRDHQETTLVFSPVFFFELRVAGKVADYLNTRSGQSPA